jgi:deazaflavin-dependent oxidoreductase (nitroreductase family)
MEPLKDLSMNDFNEKVIADFKSKGGHPGGYFKNAPVLLLYTKGAKSGAERLSPLMYLQRDEDGPIHIFASYGGAPSNPAWFHNLVAHPDVEIEVGDGTTIERIPMRARVVEGEERDIIYAEQARRFPQFAGYEEKTTRDIIPVVELTRR